MSLLIKALDKAQAEKAQTKNALKSTSKKDPAGVGDRTETPANQPGQDAATHSPLSLSPLDKASGDQASATKENVPEAKTESPENASAIKPTEAVTATTGLPKTMTVAAQQENAANVFYAKQDVDQSQNIQLAIAIGLAVIALCGLGLYYYLTLHKADSELPKLSQRALIEKPPIATDGDSLKTEPPQAVQEKDVVVTPASAAVSKSSKLFAQANQSSAIGDTEQAKLLPRHDPANISSKARRDEEPVEDQLVAKSINIKRNNAIASESASIEVTQNKPEPGVNPVLLRAYQAYNAGNDAEANQLYKQVLQRDGLNIDAMLGLGAIAARQNRSADANDWYRKVLEIEPRNSFAQAALLQLQTNNAQTAQPEIAQADESTIKSMLAKTPNDANLYANLGNLYAKQKQWPLAQQAYFDAYRLNANADNAFNLAISLDQLAKPKLALPYYRQALDLSASQANGIDLNALTARIHAIEAIEK